MKKLYTILLAASVAVSASAEAHKMQSAGTSNEVAVQPFAGANLASSAKIVKNLAGVVGKNNVATPTHRAAAKTAASNMTELCGVYEYSFYLYSSTNGGNKKGVLSIDAGAAENEVKIVGLRYSNVTVVGTVDFAAGTITCAPQECLQMEEETPGVSEDLWLYGWDDDADKEDRNKSVVFNLNADGTISSNDVFTYGVEGMPGYSYALFDKVKMTKSTTYNAIAVISERDTDDKGTFLDTYTEFTTYLTVKHEEDVMLGNDNLGECVVLDNFIFEKNTAITATYPLYVQIERDTETAFIDTWYWFDYTLSGESGRVAIVALNGNQLDGIEATYSGNTLSWEGTWGAYDNGWFGYYKNCTITLPFSLSDENAGIDDITIDNNDAPVEYFNLQGMRINEPTAGQIVIRRQGNTTTKVLVK